MSAQAAPKKRIVQHGVERRAWKAEIGRQRHLWRAPQPLSMPGEPDPPAEVDPTKGINRRFEIRIGEFVLPANPAAYRVGHATWRTTVDTPRDGDRDRRIMPDTRIHARECLDKRAVLAERDGRNSAGTIECRNGDGEAGAGRLGMTWPGIRRIRITPCGKLVQQFRQCAFERIVGMEMCRYKCCLGGIDRHPSAHQIGAGRQRPEIPLDPIGRDDGIGIRCQKHAVATRKLGSIFHGQPPCIAGARCNRRECVDANIQRIRKEIGQRSGQRSGPVDTVVGQQEHRIGLHRLPCERPETSRDPIDFVPGGDRDNGRTSGLMHS